MTLLCFLLDLRTIPPPLLRNLKQSLLQLGNFYAISPRRGAGDERDVVRPLRDTIGLCYLQRNRAADCDEIKIAYSPIGNFNLRDFHHAVNHIPTDNYLHESRDLEFPGSSTLDVAFLKLLSHEALYSWSGKNVLKKMVFVSSTLVIISEALRKILMDAAEQCVSVEFVVLEQDHYYDLSDKSVPFLESISDLENCLLRRYLPDSRVLCGLVKRWLQELNGEPVLAMFVFTNNIAASRNQLYCNLFASSNQIIDGFIPCQTCRCHGQPIKSLVANSSKKSSCPVTGRDVGYLEMIENVVKVGDQTTLFLPFHDIEKFHKVSTPVTFNVIERINLASFDEGLILGTPCVVTPSTFNEIETVSDEYGDSETNSQIFHGVRATLSLLDQGFICSSSYNTETMKDALFQCFYVLQPSDGGFMLLRRVAALEEILPVPVAMLSDDMVVSDEMVTSVHASISNMKLVDYDPLLHERGFHLKLNLLVKESLQFGAIPEKKIALSGKHDCTFELEDSVPPQSSTVEMQPMKDGIEDDLSSIAEEWEQLLVVRDVKENHAPPSFSGPTVENQIFSSHIKPIGAQTSRILERLEPPKQQKMVRTSPIIGSAVTKKPLLPLNSAGLSEPLKPTFQRLKRKQR